MTAQRIHTGYVRYEKQKRSGQTGCPTDEYRIRRTSNGRVPDKTDEQNKLKCKGGNNIHLNHIHVHVTLR